jgi:hypothetical protein
MISPRAFRTPPSAKIAKIQFIAFALRHGFGVILVGMLANFMRGTGEPLWWVTLLFGLAYAAVALFHGKKLWTLYQRRRAAEAGGQAS